jgi:hypothetical protein
MSSFTKLLSRLTSLNEAKDSPMDRIMPGFQGQARSLAKSRGASSGTREGRLAMLGILFDLDIIDDSVVRMFKNDPSVSRMVEYFEANGIASKIKSKRDEIQAHIKDQLVNKVSFTTGNRTDAAQQRYEVNKLNAELKAAKKVARLERKKETASAMSSMSQTVDMYDDLIGSLESSYSSEYMLEIIADKDSDLNDITQIVKYLSKFVDESDIEVEGRSIDVVFGASSKLGKIISRLGVEKIERQIADDLKSFGGAGVVIHEPDMNNKDMIGNLKATSIEDEEYPTEEAEDVSMPDDPYLNQLVSAMKEATGGDVDIVTDEESLNESSKDILSKVRNVGASLGVASALATAGHVVPKAYETGSEIVGDITSRGGTGEFLKRIKDDKDRQMLQNELQALRDEGTAAELSGKTDKLMRKRNQFEQLIQQMRQTYKIPDTIQIQENTSTTTALYLTEQAKRDSLKRSKPQQNLTFKERYKPKTSWQLEELRRYGL